MDKLPPNSLPDILARLRELCDENDLPIYDSKLQLQTRLIAKGITTYEARDKQTYYSDMKVAELKLECKRLGLHGYSKF